MTTELLSVAVILLVANIGAIWAVYSKLDAKLDRMEETATTRRHDLRNEILRLIGGIDDDLTKHGERLARIERNGHG